MEIEGTRCPKCGNKTLLLLNLYGDFFKTIWHKLLDYYYNLSGFKSLVF